MYYDYISPIDGKKISVKVWRAENAKCTMLICHGMAEHALRYDGLAGHLAASGINVVADDHRAHGRTDEGSLGYSEGDIFELTLKDEGGLTEWAKREFGLPVAFFGHSYGSFLGQRYIEEYGGGICAAILGGSSHLGNFATRFGAFTAGAACALGRRKKPANLIRKLTFGAYEKKCGGSFISSIAEEAERYNADPLCGFTLSNAFYKSFFRGAIKAYSEENLQKIPKTLPILIISGDNDPVGEMGEGVKRLKAEYSRLGLNAEMKLYAGARHEYLNDVCREQARSDIAHFVLSNIKENL